MRSLPFWIKHAAKSAVLPKRRKKVSFKVRKYEKMAIKTNKMEEKALKMAKTC
jgi:hypothetical protein